MIVWEGGPARGSDDAGLRCLMIKLDVRYRTQDAQQGIQTRSVSTGEGARRVTGADLARSRHSSESVAETEQGKYWRNFNLRFLTGVG